MTRATRIALGISTALLALSIWKWETRPLVPTGPLDATVPETCAGIAAAPPPTVWLSELTWEETCAALAAGFTTAIVPTAGLEQNGPHAILGKHRHVVSAAAERIARELGDALVAPVVDYVPEDTIDPPAGHMRWAGTISVPEPVFEAVIESAARSLRQHGFTFVAFVGDSGGNQRAQSRAAARLAGEWGEKSALHVSDYYANEIRDAWLREQGESAATIGTHAGIRDTSELLAVFPAGVRIERAKSGMPESSGVNGDPSRATAERGEELLRRKVAAALAQIRASR